ncbi:MAG: alpha-galactosidase [Lentisphaeria bacterium]|nr:alpha-galactosidase [Lentisphaeria bacterium]
MELAADRSGFRIGLPGSSMPFLADFRLSACIGEQRLPASGWRETAPGEFAAEAPGIAFLARFRTGGDTVRLEAECINRGNSPVTIRDLRWTRMAGEDLAAVPGPELRIYREGWTMASACGSAGWGDADFRCDPDYLAFAASAPERYEPPKPNRFTSEYVTVLMPERRRDSLLAGFVTTAGCVCRFEIELGEAQPALFDAVCCGDDIRLDPGERFRAEELLLMAGEEPYALLRRYAGLWGERMQARRWNHTPTGWCSWYYYFSKVTEVDVLENVAYIRDHHEEYPLEYVQIDDGYEAALSDWLTANDKFPHGIGFLAQEIRKAGLKPGIWLAPFMVEERAGLIVEHPEWVVHNSAGEIAWTTEWRGNRVAILDGTHPGAQAYLRNVFRLLAETGYEYVKLDFMMYAGTVKDGRYHDPKATRVQALRRGLQAIRDGFGSERFILGCTTLLGASAGLVDAERIGTDITPYWQPENREIYAEAPTVPNVCRNVLNRIYMHRNVWLNDPDVHIARLDNNKLNEEEIRLWTSVLWMAGGLTLLCDRFETLAPERAELSKLLLRRTDAFEDVRPLDFRESTVPSVLYGRFSETGAPVYGFFNFEDEPRTISCRCEAGVYREHWGGECVQSSGELSRTVPPHGCRLFFGSTQ